MGTGAVQNKLHNKRLMRKYLGRLYSATFTKYSSLNSKDKNNVRSCCIITITSIHYK